MEQSRHHGTVGCVAEIIDNIAVPDMSVLLAELSEEAPGVTQILSKEVLEKISCIKVLTDPPTTALGCDGARALICDTGCLSHLSCNSCCTPDVKTGSSQAAIWT